MEVICLTFILVGFAVFAVVVTLFLLWVFHISPEMSQTSEQRMYWLVGFVGLALVTTLMLVVLAESPLVKEIVSEQWFNLGMNLGTEIIGAVVMYWLLERFLGEREKREEAEKAKEQLKRDLIAKMSSGVNDVAVAAAEELRRHGWHSDGSLGGEKFPNAGLQDASLSGFDFEKAHLISANLQRSCLIGANLQGVYAANADLRKATLISAELREAELPCARLDGADLTCAKLQRADLYRAYLLGVRLHFVNLQGAKLNLAHLQGADFREANLQDVELFHAEFDNTTILPDGTKWTLDTNMARFTDPYYPKFWRSDRSNSPAYQSNDNEQTERQSTSDPPAATSA
ncbi:MAG: pentapeptide repeat-containing protein [Anaerolineae bacterium]|nr:pentapeptide repeat-containing protein [Anaerolineae bacterium]